RPDGPVVHEEPHGHVHRGRRPVVPEDRTEHDGRDDYNRLFDGRILGRPSGQRGHGHDERDRLFLRGSREVQLEGRRGARGAPRVISGPVTVTRPGARSGSWSVNTSVEETVIESCAEASRTTVAPLEPPLAWARRRSGTLRFASTVTFVSVVPARGSPTFPRLADQPTAASSSAFVRTICTTSRSFPPFVTWTVSFRNRPSKVAPVELRETDRDLTR